MTVLSVVRFSICLFIGICFSYVVSAQPKPYNGGSGKYKQLVWSDEFNYNGLPDSTKWTYESGYIRNKERQYYTVKREQNAKVANGYLTITARNDSFKTNGNSYPLTSASLTTKGKKDWKYGRIEVRAKIPSSLGTWPAIWMLGSNEDEVGWPACGEIDIMEHVGFMPDTVHFNVHTGSTARHIDKGIKVPYASPDSDFHVYALEWFNDHMDWYMDDKKVFTYIRDASLADGWPFDKPEYLILNLAFGGEWGGQKGVNMQSLPQSFLVDYVRVFK